MSAIPSMRLVSDLPGSAGKWIDADEAARRSGLSVGHVVRLCDRRFGRDGLADLRATEGGKSRWFVREDADARFAPAKTRDAVSAEVLQALKETQKRVALERLKLVEAWERFVSDAQRRSVREADATREFIASLPADAKASRSALFDWRDRYRREGLSGLVDGRSRKSADGCGLRGDPFFQEIQRLYLTPRKLKLAFCHELAAHKAQEHGWQVRSYKSTQRFVKTIPAAVVYKMRGGNEAYVNEAEPYIERDYTTLESNETWNADHHLFDVVVSAGGKLVRPWLTAFQDLRSRKIVGWRVYAHDPNSDVIITTIREAMLAHGVPAKLMIDNGKDFDSKALNGRTKMEKFHHRNCRLDLDKPKWEGLFAAVGINVGHCWAYHGQSKPIERWFGFVESRMCAWPTYCGANPQNKPEDLEKRLAAGEAPTLGEFAEWFGEWVNQYNATHAHSGQGMEGKTPDVVWAEHLRRKRTVTAELLDVLCLAKVGPVRVQQNGVRFHGLNYGQREAALHRLFKKQVYLRVDERDVTRVQVYTLEDEFVCIALANQMVPANADKQILREAIASKRADSRLRKEYLERRPQMIDDLPDRMLRIGAARAAAAPPPRPAPDSIQPVRHDLEDQLDAIGQAMEARKPMRKAVGAESMEAGVDYLAVIGDRLKREYEEKRRREEAEEIDFSETLAAAVRGEPPRRTFHYEPEPQAEEPLPRSMFQLMEGRMKEFDAERDES